MDGILYVLDELGRGMAQLKAEVVRLAQENAALREQLAVASAPSDPPASPPP
jgi:hypothetical protein